MLKEMLESLEGNHDFIEKKYLVDAGMDNETRQFFDTNSPEEAITKWVEFQKKFPTQVAIFAKNGKGVKELYNWVFSNLDKYARIIAKQKAYKTNYLYKEVQAVNLQKLNVLNSGLPPFTMG